MKERQVTILPCSAKTYSETVYFQLTLKHVFYIFHNIFFSTMMWFTKTVHLLLVQPLCQILELIVAHKSKSLPSPGLDIIKTFYKLIMMLNFC